MALFKPYKFPVHEDLTLEKAVPSLSLSVPDSGAFATFRKNANAGNDFGTNIIDGVDEENYTRMILAHAMDGLSLERIVDGNLSETIHILSNKNVGNFVSGGLKVETGSYKGSGKYGESNYNSLYFSFHPRIVFIHGHETYNGGNYGGTGLFIAPFFKINTTVQNGYWFLNEVESDKYVRTDVSSCSKYVSDKKELRWWNGTDHSQLNSSRVTTYNWIALG